MGQDKRSPLFSDFPPVSTGQWEEKIQADLKGADYEKRLVWKSPEGLKVRPYYRSEHLDGLPHVGVLPGQPPYVRGPREKGNEWVIRQDFVEEDVQLANALARQSIEKGVQAVGLNASAVNSREHMMRLLEGIDPAVTGIHLLHGKDYPALLDLLLEVKPAEKLQGSLNFDPLAYFLLYGKFYGGQQGDMEQAKELLERCRELPPGFYPLAVNAQHIHNAGGSAVQEMAFALAQAVEYLSALTGMGLSVDEIAPRMQFTFAVGSSYFMEIAKVRAVRMLWHQVVAQYKPARPESSKMRVHVCTSNWNKSVYDPYVNMLRTTTEAMAASVGGADSVTVEPFDKAFRKPSEFSYRMARNQQIILKHEAYFNKVADPAAGSYYIEQLTDSLAQAAWKLFLEVEDQGGFVRSVHDGFVRSSVEDTCQQRDMAIAMRKKVFVGTNLYPNTEERVLDKVEPTASLSDLAGLRQYRGPQAFEALRMSVENHVSKGFKLPVVFHFTYGDPVMRKARATFSANFFGVAGYKVVDNLGFPDLDSGVKAALEAGADIVVLCSSDDQYAEMAPAATAIKERSPDTQVVVAGYPKDLVEQLQQAGVDHFVHLRTNVLDALTRFNDILGV